MTDQNFRIFIFILRKLFLFLHLLEGPAAYGGPDRDRRQLERE